MSRSGYSEHYDNEWQLIRYRGAVTSALNGKRGQSFLKEMLVALDALSEKKLVSNALQDEEGSVCAIGAVGKARNLDMSGIDPEDPSTVSHIFNIAEAMCKEIAFVNDEEAWHEETPEQRYARVRSWVVASLKPESTPKSS